MNTDVITLEYIIDKSILKEVQSSITEGEKLINDTTIGTEIGNISKSDSNKLKHVLAEAKDLIKKDSANYNDISNINDKIKSAIDEFKNNIIKPVDKSKLKSAISQAKQLYNNSTEGSQTGQYKSGSKSTLMNAINKAEEVYNNSSAKQDEVDLATSNLNSAINTFKSNKVTQGDRNSDGSYTRSYIKQYYAKKLRKDFDNQYGQNVIDEIVIHVGGPQDDKFYNNEVCYLLIYYPKSSQIVGDGTWEYYVGSKTLREYSYREMGISY